MVSAYTPTDEGFVQVLLYATSDNKNDVLLGETVDFSILINNYWNDTMSNLTITQVLPSDTVLISLGLEELSTEEGDFIDFEINNERTEEVLRFNYMNISQNNFTGNLDMTLNPGESIMFNFVLNFTTIGDYNLDFPNLTYYDNWGDKQNDVEGLGTIVSVSEVDVDSRLKFVPQFDIEEPNYVNIGMWFIGVSIIVISSRLLYGKKPFN
jgi:uncharacterized repeat protein (TIGR01451 family)